MGKPKTVANGPQSLTMDRVQKVTYGPVHSPPYRLPLRTTLSQKK